MGNNRPRPAHRPRSKATGPFSRWIESLRDKSGARLTYPKVAELLGCSVQTVSNLRAGHTLPGRELANRIAEASRGMVPASSWDRRRAA